MCLRRSKASVAGEAYVWGRVVAEISSGGFVGDHKGFGFHSKLYGK